MILDVLLQRLLYSKVCIVFFYNSYFCVNFPSTCRRSATAKECVYNMFLFLVGEVDRGDQTTFHKEVAALLHEFEQLCCDKLQVMELSKYHTQKLLTVNRLQPTKNANFFPTTGNVP